MTLAEFITAWRELNPVMKGKCFYCGVQTRRKGQKPHHAILQTKDHVIPVSTGGGSRGANCVVCCRKCNTKKSDLTLQEFRQRIGIETFHAETVLGVRIDDLSDIADVTLFVLNNRKPATRSIKCDGRPDPDSNTFEHHAKAAGC